MPTRQFSEAYDVTVSVYRYIHVVLNFEKKNNNITETRTSLRIVQTDHFGETKKCDHSEACTKPGLYFVPYQLLLIMY